MMAPPPRTCDQTKLPCPLPECAAYDRCVAPDMACPHCGETLQAEYPEFRCPTHGPIVKVGEEG